MTTDLRTLVEPLKREVAVPGTFEDIFPNTTDDQLAFSLADAMSEAQLQGFFGDVVLEVDLSQNPTTVSTSRDLSAAGGALIVMFAGMRILRAQLRTLAQSSTYKAGSTEYSTSAMTTVVRDELRALNDRLNQLILDGRRSGRSVNVLDGYRGRITAYTGNQVGGFYPYEFRG